MAEAIRGRGWLKPSAQAHASPRRRGARSARVGIDPLTLSRRVHGGFGKVGCARLHYIFIQPPAEGPDEPPDRRDRPSVAPPTTTSSDLDTGPVQRIHSTQVRPM